MTATYGGSGVNAISATTKYATRPRGEFHLAGGSPSPPGRGSTVGIMAPSAAGRPRLTLPHLDPLALELTAAVHGGDLAAVRRLLGDKPGLAAARMIGRHGPGGGWRTPLHALTDWPGYFPAGPATAALLLEAGADPDDDTGGERPETPLHWAASTDDVDVAAVLIGAGARLDRPGGSIGTPLDNAVGYGCWHVARLLVASGAPVESLWQAAALGMLDRLDELLAAGLATQEDLDHGFWQACHGGQRRAAERLLSAGADIGTRPAYSADKTALDIAVAPDTRRDLLAAWLRERGAPTGP